MSVDVPPAVPASSLASDASELAPPALAAADLPSRAAGRAPVGVRRVLWGVLLALLLVAQSALVWLTLRYEASHSQDGAEATAASAATELRRLLLRAQQNAQALTWNEPPLPQWRQSVSDMLRQHREMLRVERRSPQGRLVLAVEAPWSSQPLFAAIARPALEEELQAACAQARRSSAPAYSRSYFVPQADGSGQEVVDLCIALTQGGHPTGSLVLTLSLATLLEEAGRSTDGQQRHEFSLVEADGTRLVRAGSVRGAGLYSATRLVDLPGNALQLKADSAQGPPGLIPNLATALVLGLSLALLGVVGWLAHDMRRRSQAERALAESLALRRAMEDSLVTGLRARDARGRITYVNPAFCQMVGFSVEELVQHWPPPYWPPEQVALYLQRQAERLTLPDGNTAPQREGFETLFMRKSGERFPVMIYEAPLFDRLGRHAGWMSAVLDVSAERRMEEVSRQQQERLQATARLATVGEMASLLSHELNQPLSAIASYATGSLNLLEEPDPGLLPLLRQALERIAEQAERAGRIIKSVHGFVRRRDGAREVLAADQLIEGVLPLVRLQARKSGTRIEVDIPRPVPRVLADRTMVEQVLLNLSRNGIQAMEQHTPLAARQLRIAARPEAGGRRVCFEVTDAGAGIAPDVASRLFTPFFTTKAEGMGLGLSLCRTVVEQHGGELVFEAAAPDARGQTGTVFRFTLPAPEAPRRAVPESAR